jgi:hypothetical protein
MPCVGFETTIPSSERAKSVHASDRSATVTGNATFTYIHLINVHPFWPKNLGFENNERGKNETSTYLQL